MAPHVRPHRSADALLHLVRSGFAGVPTHRLDETELACTAARRSALALCSLTAPSLRACDKERAEGKVPTISGMERVLCDTDRRHSLAPGSPQGLRPVCQCGVRPWPRGTAVAPMGGLAGHESLARDGTASLASQTMHCAACPAARPPPWGPPLVPSNGGRRASSSGPPGGASLEAGTAWAARGDAPTGGCTAGHQARACQAVWAKLGSQRLLGERRSARGYDEAFASRRPRGEALGSGGTKSSPLVLFEASDVVPLRRRLRAIAPAVRLARGATMPVRRARSAFAQTACHGAARQSLPKTGQGVIAPLAALSTTLGA